MAITHWNPNTKTSRGNVILGFVPSVADINAPTLTEIEVSKNFECSVTNFQASSSVDSESVDWVCSPTSEQLPSTLTHSIDDIDIKVSGQNDSDLLNSLKIGDIVFIYRRDGLATSEAPKTGEFVWIWKVIVTSVDPLEASNAYIGLKLHISVLDRSQTAVAIK